MRLNRETLTRARKEALAGGLRGVAVGAVADVIGFAVADVIKSVAMGHLAMYQPTELFPGASMQELIGYPVGLVAAGGLIGASFAAATELVS